MGPGPMDLLAKLGILQESLGSTFGKHPPESILLDPADADNYFARILQQLDSSGVGELLNDYLNVTRSYSDRTVKDQRYWREEGSMWDLIKICTINYGSLVDSNREVRDSTCLSPQSILQDFLSHDPNAIRLVKIKEWLEASAPESIPAEIRKVPVPIFTVHDDEAASKIPSFDPDSLAKYLSYLRPEDVDYEEAQLKTLYDHLRRGSIHEAIAWCIQTDQPWRAAMIAGGFAFFDPKLDGQALCLSDDVSGNPDRSLWRESITDMLKQASLSRYERAIYSVLVGNVSGIEPVCSGWKDYLWASLLNILETLITEQLADLSHQVDSQPVTSRLSDVFYVIEQSPDCSSDVFYPAVKSLILGSDYFEALFSVINHPVPEQFPRFAAFSSILLDQLRPGQPQYYDVILHAYLTLLLRDHKRQYFTFLTAKIRSEPFKIDTFSAFLEKLLTEPKSVKWSYLHEAQQYGIPIDMTIASLIRNVLPAILSGHEQDAVALLEWPLFDEVQMRPVIFDLAALFLRLFLLAKDYRKARHVLEALPPHFYSNRQVLLSLVNDPQFGPFAKEIFYYRQLVDLLTAYEQWAMAYAEARSLLGEHENTEVVLGNFKFQTDQFCMDALKFLQADWLSDVETAACQFVDSSREDELLRLREIYISEIIVLLVAILKLPEAPSDLVVEALEILADPEYEYWNELASQKQLDTVLYTLRSYGKLDERMSNAIERLAAHIRR